MKYIKRIISLPFVFSLMVIAHSIFIIKRTINFLKNGGEYIDYEENEKKTIKDIYDLIKKENDSRK